MHTEPLRIIRRTMSRGSSALDSISKIVKEEGSNISFSLTRDSFLNLFLDPLMSTTASHKIVEGNIIAEIHYATSRESVKFLLNETQDLFTLISANTLKLKYEYPENTTALYLIDSSL